MYFDISNKNEQIAIITKDKQYTYRQLREQISYYDFISEQKEVVLILCGNRIEIIAAYMATLQAGHAAMLMDEATNPKLIASIIEMYKPKWIVGIHDVAYYVGYESVSTQNLETVSINNQPSTITIYSDLALLLSTSGTTGSPKFVRLSYRNMQSNAESIVEYLNIKELDRGILNLPLSYSYGLSILNSYFQAGASVLLTEDSVLSKDFWSFVQEHKATSLPGVPFTYQMLNRVGFTKMELPYLTVLTQAGGRLDQRLVEHYAQYAKEQNKQFYVMYGQTEAAPRMSYIPANKVLEKQGTIGIPIPQGRFEIAPETNELIYYGPNVMLGYAEARADLAKGDECYGKLYTGDCAEVDSDGYYTITGRMKRFLKIYGLRINLDEIEKKLETMLLCTVACVGNDDKLYVVLENEHLIQEAKKAIEELYKLHKSAYKVLAVPKIPHMSNGKTDYKKIKDEIV